MGAKENDLQGRLALLALSFRRADARIRDYLPYSNGSGRTAVASRKARFSGASPHGAGGLAARNGASRRKREARFYSVTARGRKQPGLEEASGTRLAEGVARGDALRVSWLWHGVVNCGI